MKRFLFILLSVVAVSCHKGPGQKILPEDKMADILTDMQLAESASRLQLMPEEYLADPQKWYAEIMQEHGTDTATFNRSLHYYHDHPKQLMRIYDKVNANLVKQSGVAPPAGK